MSSEYQKGRSGKCTFKDPDGSGEVIDSSGCPKSCRDDGRRRDEIVGENVVQVTLL